MESSKFGTFNTAVLKTQDLFSRLKYRIKPIPEEVKNMEKDSLCQAEADLKAARDSYNSENYEWVCFQSQQAAEKALKSFLYLKGYTSIVTHSLKELTRESEKINADFSNIKESAHQLDMYYIPTRYPNGLAGDLAPVEFYEKGDAEKCLDYAESILNNVKKYIEN